MVEVNGSGQVCAARASRSISACLLERRREKYWRACSLPQSLDETLGQVLRVLDIDDRNSTLKALFIQVLIELGISKRNDVSSRDFGSWAFRGIHCVTPKGQVKGKSILAADSARGMSGAYISSTGFGAHTRGRTCLGRPAFGSRKGKPPPFLKQGTKSPSHTENCGLKGISYITSYQAKSAGYPVLFNTRIRRYDGSC